MTSKKSDLKLQVHNIVMYWIDKLVYTYTVGSYSYKYAYVCIRSYYIYIAKQKHLGCKKVQGQSEVALQTGRCNQKL